MSFNFRILDITYILSDTDNYLKNRNGLFSFIISLFKGKVKKRNGVLIAGVTFYYSFITLLSGVSKNKGCTIKNIWPRVYPLSYEHLTGVMWKETEEGNEKT